MGLYQNFGIWTGLRIRGLRVRLPPSPPASPPAFVMQNALRASRVNICFGSFLLENATLKYKEATVHISRTSCYADMIEITHV